jgi:hypothetical protein
MNIRRDIPLPLMVVAVILFLPLIIPAGLVVMAIEKRRKRNAAAFFACVKCHAVLGLASLRLADDECRRHMDELRRKHPFSRFRVVRTCHAICANCGARYTFREKERTFELESAERSA